MQFRVVRMCRDQSAIDGFGLIVLPGTGKEVGQFPLCIGIVWRKFQRGLKFRDGIIFFPCTAKTRPSCR